MNWGGGSTPPLAGIPTLVVHSQRIWPSKTESAIYTNWQRYSEAAVCVCVCVCQSVMLQP